MPVLNEQKTNQKTTAMLTKLMDDLGWSVSRVGTIIGVYPGVIDSWLKRGAVPHDNENLNKLFTIHHKLSRKYRPSEMVDFFKRFNLGTNCSYMMLMYDEDGLDDMVAIVSREVLW